MRTAVEPSGFESCGRISWVRLKQEKKKKKKKDGAVVVMPFSPLNSGFFISHPHHKSENASQNTPSPSPQNKMEMKRTNPFVLLRFPAVFSLLQSSVFSFCVYSSCFFGGFLSSYVTSTQNGKTISLRIFSFSNKVVYQFGRHYPFPIKGLDMWPRFHYLFAFKFFLTIFV